jgi:hypothetical protein
MKLTKQTMQANCWQFQLSVGCSGTMGGALADGAHLGLHLKPLGATNGEVPAPYCPGDCHVWQFWMKHKAQLLWSNYHTFFPNQVNFGTKIEPYTQLINVTSCVKIWDVWIEAEELADISSYQTLTADKNWKSY